MSRAWGKASKVLRLVCVSSKLNFPSEQLHAEQREDDEEEEEEEQQRGDGLHRVEERRHQVGQGCPMTD